MSEERWKCKKCNHVNVITPEQKKKANRNFGILNTSMVILSGGMWFLIILMKDLMLFSFDTGGVTNITPGGAGKQKQTCQVCGSEK